MFFSIESAVRRSVICVTPRWLITPHPAYLSRVMHQRLVREYVPCAAACLNSHSLRTFRSYAGAAIAHAEYLRLCGVAHAAAQHV